MDPIPDEVQVAIRAAIRAYDEAKSANLPPDVCTQLAGVAFHAVIDLSVRQADRLFGLAKTQLVQ